ncbi:MAG: sigma-70 family RNA polymerase sigma factor [Phycisphaerae bacterium]|nr:sigma-70 family RNA polymerase sigma factor [Phycisphaerae bacterium]
METIESLVTTAADSSLASPQRLAAFGRIVLRFQDMAYGCAYALLGDFHLAEDAAQEAFLTAYRQLPKLRQPGAFPGWFRRIVLSQCRRLTRRKSLPSTALDAAAAVPSSIPPPPQNLARRETKDKVLAAIAALPEHQRMATTLFYINGYSQKDVAEFLEVPLTTVKKRLADSRTKLKERMIAMVKDEFKKRSLPEEFSQRVLTFAQIMKHGEGKDYIFQFANGVRVRSRIDKVFQDESQLHLLICGPTEIICHSGEPWPGPPDSFSFDSFVLVPSALVTVTQFGKVVKPGLEGGELPSSYEIVGPNEPKYEDKTQYMPSAVSTGPLDISPDGCFAFIRIGKDQRPHKYHGRGQDTTEYSWHISPDDIYVSEDQLQNYRLKQGDIVKCSWRRGAGNERFRAAVDILAINQTPPELNQ